MKKYLLSLITLTFFLCEASFTGGGMVFAATTWNNLGETGSDVSATLDDGVLTISGTGKLAGFANISAVPWKDYRNGGITSIVIEDGVTSIGAYAFYNCSTAVSVTIPASVDSIANNVFSNCKFTDKVYYQGTLEDWCKVKLIGTTGNPFYYQYNSTGTSQACTFRINGTSVTTINIPEGITKVSPYAFAYMTNITTVTIPSTVKSIGAYAFRNCTGIGTVTFADGSQLDSIATYAFAGSNKSTFTKIVFPSSLRVIESSAFNGCSGLKTIDFSNASNLKTIAASAFNGTTALTAIDLRGATKLTTIGNSAFSLTSASATATGFLYLPSTLRTIGTNAYKNRSGITAIVILNPNSSDLTTAQSNTFTGMSGVSAIYVYKYSSTPYDRLVTSYSAATGWNTFSSSIFTCENNITWNCGSPTASALVAKLNVREGTLTFTGSGAMKDYGKTSDTAPWLAYPTVLKTAAIANMTHVGSYAFYLCTNLTGSISFDSSIESIGSGAFWGCTGLSELNFNNATNLTTIRDNAFYNCSSVTSLITLPSSLTTMEAYAFQSCKSITGIKFADGFQLTSLPNYAFDNCYKLAGTISIPASITTIGEYAFRNCSTVVAIDMSKTTELTTIGQYAFYGMTGVTGELYIPSKVSSIGTYAFNNMRNLSCIVAMPTTPPTAASAYTFNSVNKNIPVYVKNETTKNKYLANDCTGWKDFTNYKYETDPEQCGDDLYWQFRFSTNRVIFTGSGDMWNYNNSDNKAPWRVYNNYLKYADFTADLTSIGDYAFYQCTNYIPSNLTIKASVERIGQYAFHSCSGISSIAFANGTNLTSIGARAFQNCSKISNITIPDGVTELPTGCFYGCSKLSSIKFPQYLETIGEYAFTNCSTLSQIDLPATVTYIGNQAFAGCTAIGYIKSDNIDPPTATSSTFNNINTSTTLVCVPEGSTDAYCNAPGWGAFCGKTGNEIGGVTKDVNWRLNFATGLLTIYGTGKMDDYSSGSGGAPWLVYSEAIEKLVIEEGVTNVGAYALNQATNLEEVTLPSTITYVGDYAFNGDVNINKITCVATDVPTVKSHGVYQSGMTYVSSAFANVPNNIVVTVPLSAIATYKTTGVVSNSVSLTGWNYFTNYHATGTCGASGDNLLWDYADATHTLSITGEGAMADYASNTAMPWNSVKASITTLVIGDEVTSIGKYAFAGSGIISLNDLPSSLTSIGYHAFENCTALASITIPRYVTKIGDGMVINSSSLSTVVWNAENCTTVLKNDGTDIAMSSSWNPFYGTTPRNKITSFTFGENVAVIPNGLCSSMNNEAFTSITIPSSVTSIGANAFDGCTGITSVASNAVNPPAIQSSSFPSAVESAATLKLLFSAEVRAAYDETTWSEFAHITPYLLSFDMQDHGVAISSICANAGRVPNEQKPVGPTETGYTFGGWYQEEGCSTPFTFGESGTEVSADMTLYAKWTANNYYITYKDKGDDVAYSGSNIGSLPATHTYDAATELVDGVKTGYTFDGWFANSDCTGDAVTSLGATDYTDDITLYAKWTINQYTVSFNSNGGSAVASITQDYNSAVAAPADPTKTGYAFAGWTPAVPSIMPAENTECVAQWTINQYTVSFDSNGGSEVSSITQDYNSAVTAPADPTKTGYTFDGWSPAVPSTMPAENVECVAQWTINSYDVTFDLQGHGDPMYQTIDYNGTVTEPSPAPSEENYTFGGWYKEAGCSNAWDFAEDKVTDDLILYAKWTLNGLALDENANNASLLAAYNGLITNVTMTRGALTNAQYNTFCLPFALSNAQLEEYFGAGYDLEEFVKSSLDGDVLDLTFNKVTSLVAGKPYLLKPYTNEPSLSFSDVTIAATSPADQESDTYISFHAVYSPTELEGGNRNLLFLGAGNELFWPESTGNLKGFRAYFEVKGAGMAAKRARIVKKEDTATGIETITNDQSPVTNKIIKDNQLFIIRDGKTYNAQGMRVE